MKVVQPVQTFGVSSSTILILDLDVQLGLFIWKWYQYCTKHSIKNSFLTARCYICCKLVSTLQGPFSMQSSKNMTKNNMIKILNNTKMTSWRMKTSKNMMIRIHPRWEKKDKHLLQKVKLLGIRETLGRVKIIIMEQANWK